MSEPKKTITVLLRAGTDAKTRTETLSLIAAFNGVRNAEPVFVDAKPEDPDHIKNALIVEADAAKAADVVRKIAGLAAVELAYFPPPRGL